MFFELVAPVSLVIKKASIMIYALLKALILKPQLLAEHLRNYGELVREEARDTARLWAIKAAALLVCAIGMLVFLTLTGVAVMLGIMQGRYHWVLVAVPAVPLVLAVVALAIASRKAEKSSVGTIKQQFAADMQALTGPAVKDHEH